MISDAFYRFINWLVDLGILSGRDANDTDGDGQFG